MRTEKERKRAQEETSKWKRKERKKESKDKEKERGDRARMLCSAFSSQTTTSQDKNLSGATAPKSNTNSLMPEGRGSAGRPIYRRKNVRRDMTKERGKKGLCLRSNSTKALHDERNEFRVNR